jgi:hypothetical protein
MRSICEQLHREVHIAKWAVSASALTVIAGLIFSLIYTHFKLGSQENIGHQFPVFQVSDYDYGLYKQTAWVQSSAPQLAG